MKATNLILATVITLTAVTTLAEKTDRPRLTPKEARNYVRQPYGTPTVIDRKYDGWIIRSDIFFYNRIVKHLKIIKKGAPEMYAVGQKNVYLIVRNHEGPSTAFMDGHGRGGVVGIANRELNYIHRSLVTYMLMHEFQHCDPRDGSEGAACWTVVQYGKQTGVHPWVIKCHTAYAVKHGYSQAKWDAHLRK